MNLIVATEKNWGIGREGRLLVHLPGDLRYFKEKTAGKVVIMGRKTLESLPGGKPLPQRVNIVISHDPSFSPDGCVTAGSCEEAAAKARMLAGAQGEDGIFVIGGEAIYRQMLALCDTCYVTRMEQALDADRFFPDLDRDPAFTVAWESTPTEENGIRYRFVTYVRKAPDAGRPPTGGAPREMAAGGTEEAAETASGSALLIGRNPVLEALKNDRPVDKLLVAAGAREGSINKILGMARDRRIPVLQTARATLDRLAAGRPHQGVIAYVSAYAYATLEDVFALAESRGEPPLLILLDNLEDPHNLGAILRTADGAGAHGVILPRRRACGLTEVVAKASAGAIEYVPCVRVGNLVQTIHTLQQRGLWVVACDMDGQPYYEADLQGPLAIVIGSEGRGISRLTREACDFAVSMPMVGHITSLNASNAAAVLLYEIRRQRDTGRGM